MSNENTTTEADEVDSNELSAKEIDEAANLMLSTINGLRKMGFYREDFNPAVSYEIQKIRGHVVNRDYEKCLGNLRKAARLLSAND